MLRDILHNALSPEPDMELTGECADAATLQSRVKSETPDIVIIGFEQVSCAEAWPELLRGMPPTKVFAIEDRGQASLYELRPTCTLLGEASPERLRGWIREAAQPMVVSLRSDSSDRAVGNALFSWTDPRDAS